MVKKLLNTFSYYLKYCGLKPNFSKCGFPGIGSLNGVEVVVCGIKCVILKINTIKILGIHFSYKIKLNMEKKILNRNMKHLKCSQNLAHEKFNFRR